MPERTFEWTRYVYLVVHGRQNDPHIPYPNILEERYLQEIERLEQDIAENVAFGMRNVWRSNSTAHIHDIVKFDVSRCKT